MSAQAVFVQDAERFTATDLALGPWAAGALHGGAAAALLVHELTSSSASQAGLALARMTVEFVRPVPQTGLSVEVGVVRPGRRVTLLDAVLSGDGGGEVCRARGLFVAPATVSAVVDVSADFAPPPFPGPEAGEVNDWRNPAGPMCATDAMEIRFVEGRFREPGPATAWFRLRHPLLAGQPTAPLELLAAAGDFGNGIASVLSWEEHMFINPDLTLFVARPPDGEWVALQSVMRVTPGAVAVAESVLWDEHGRLGRAVQTLLVGPR